MNQVWKLQATLAKVKWYLLFICSPVSKLVLVPACPTPPDWPLVIRTNTQLINIKFLYAVLGVTIVLWGCLIMLVNDKMSQMQNRVRHCKAANRYNSRLLIREQLKNIIDTWCFWFLSPFLKDIWCASSYLPSKSIYLLLRVTIFHSAT